MADSPAPFAWFVLLFQICAEQKIFPTAVFRHQCRPPCENELPAENSAAGKARTFGWKCWCSERGLWGCFPPVAAEKAAPLSPWGDTTISRVGTAAQQDELSLVSDQLSAPVASRTAPHRTPRRWVGGAPGGAPAALRAVCWRSFPRTRRARQSPGANTGSGGRFQGPPFHNPRCSRAGWSQFSRSAQPKVKCITFLFPCKLHASSEPVPSVFQPQLLTRRRDQLNHQAHLTPRCKRSEGYEFAADLRTCKQTGTRQSQAWQELKIIAVLQQGPGLEQPQPAPTLLTALLMLGDFPVTSQPGVSPRRLRPAPGRSSGLRPREGKRAGGADEQKLGVGRERTFSKQSPAGEHRAPRGSGRLEARGKISGNAASKAEVLVCAPAQLLRLHSLPTAPASADKEPASRNLPSPGRVMARRHPNPSERWVGPEEDREQSSRQ